MTIVSVVGARPQFVKLAPLSGMLRQSYTEIVVHTGQHYDSNMSEQFFVDLGIPAADYHLGIGSGSHGLQTGRMLAKLDELLVRERPLAVIVFGDTNSTLAGALAAAKLHIPVFHIEAGLRSFNKQMPEEINRVLTDHCADYLFAPTTTAMRHLQNEGLKENAFLTGDIMVDALQQASAVAKQDTQVLEKYRLRSGSYNLMTLHRPYNVDDPKRLQSILHLLNELDETFVFPVHPRTRRILQEYEIAAGECIKLIEPQGYLDFVNLQQNARKIFTDSGGIQKEAFILGKPCITLRPETEWVETVEAGWNILLDPKMPDFLDQALRFSPEGSRPELYGRDVSGKMVSLIGDLLSSRSQ